MLLMKHVCPVLLALFIFTSINIQAQKKDSHSAAALECLLAMKTNQAVDKSSATVLEGMIKADPDLAKYRDILWNYFDKYICWTNLKDDYVKAYAAAFTENELREMTAFFKTTTGQKLIDKLPEVYAKHSEINQKVIQDHIEELSALIQQRENETKK